MAPAKQIQVTFDCAEPQRLALFRCEASGYVVPPPPDGFASWDEFEGKLVKNGLHIDVRADAGQRGQRVRSRLS